MKPTIGRIVHFHPADFDTEARNDHEGTGPVVVPAIITRVWTDDLVNLTVFPDNGPPIVRSSVHRLASTRTNPYGWEWPPRA